MKRVAGFALFWLAFGILISLLVSNTFVEIMCILICLLAGYNLFFCS